MSARGRVEVHDRFDRTFGTRRGTDHLHTTKTVTVGLSLILTVTLEVAAPQLTPRNVRLELVAPTAPSGDAAVVPSRTAAASAFKPRSPDAIPEQWLETTGLLGHIARVAGSVRNAADDAALRGVYNRTSRGVHVSVPLTGVFDHGELQAASVSLTGAVQHAQPDGQFTPEMGLTAPAASAWLDERLVPALQTQPFTVPFTVA